MERRRELGVIEVGHGSAASWAYQAAGRTDEAIALHEQTLAAMERTLGPDHPSTVSSRNNLGHGLPGRGPHRPSMKSEPSLLIRRSMEGVRSVRRNPYQQVSVLPGVRRRRHSPVPSGQSVRNR